MPRGAVWSLARQPELQSFEALAQNPEVMGFNLAKQLSLSIEMAVKAMLSLKLRLIFPDNLVTQPVLYHLGHQYQIVTSIRKAEILEDSAWLLLEMRGKAEAVEEALKHLGEIGVSVAPIEGDLVQ